MAIRMVPDDNQPQQQRKLPGGGGGGGRGGGGNIITMLLPLLLGMFRKNPKLGCGVLILGAVVIYFMRGSLLNIGGDGGGGSITDLFNTGANFDPQKYDATEIFEPPLTDNAKNPLPESISLLKYAPERKNQGSQGSCVGWGSAYAARTILEAQRTGKDPDQIAFSPAYLYNQIGLENCQGAYINNAMDVMKNEGLISLREFPYTDQDCERKPTSSQKQEASQYKMTGFNRLTEGDAKGVGQEKIDLVAIKQNLAQGAPVVIGMMVGGTFMQPMMGKDIWNPTDNDLNMNGFGGHCMCVIGYDDYKEGGAFQIMNSWGNDWGNQGVAWIPYNVFEKFVVEAYGVYPMGNASKPLSNILSVEFGLIDNATKKNIPLTTKSAGVFSTRSAVKKGTKFKIQVTNSLECYTYIFATDENNNCDILFPYTEKHSPYCGITGTRLFPKDYSMELDQLGSKDYMAIVVTKQPLDYKTLNDNVNKQSGTYEQKLRSALSGQLINNVKFIPGETVKFQTDAGTNGAVLMVIEVDKY
ncbi:MAG: peptidase C1 [Bacteroidetes bacterium]|nr:peptidase C1 [Bacteroidota bacterium]